MYAQLAFFDGPRSPELVSAGDRAGRDRIGPALENDPQLRDELVSVMVLRKPDGAQVIVIVTRSEQGLTRHRQVVREAKLLPGEDPALLPGPDRIETYQVVDTLPGTPAQA
jgi:hypothetical protein